MRLEQLATERVANLEQLAAERAAGAEQLAAERSIVADELATALMERSEYRQATLDAALGRVSELERERDQARAAVKTLGATVLDLTERLANVDI